jgi:hypothetical protein
MYVSPLICIYTSRHISTKRFPSNMYTYIVNTHIHTHLKGGEHPELFTSNMNTHVANTHTHTPQRWGASNGRGSRVTRLCVSSHKDFVFEAFFSSCGLVETVTWGVDDAYLL